MLTAVHIHGQDIPLDVQEYLESHFNNADQTVDYIPVVESLLEYLESPVNINKAEYDDLKELHLLTDRQIEDILRHRKQFGNFIAIEELQTIESLELADIRRLRHFIKVQDNTKLRITHREIMNQSRHEIFLKWSRILQSQKGFLEDSLGRSIYLGSRDKQFIRWKSRYENRFKLGLTLEKDPGEPFYNDFMSLGYDYMSLHFHVKDFSYLLKDIVIGDYTVSMGQGLITHRDFGTGKSAMISRVKKGGRTIRPYNSIQENGFKRGMAATIRPSRRIELTLFGSNVKRDGNILSQDTLDEQEPALQFSSFQSSGNHRTESELEDRKSVGIKSLGGVLKYKSESFTLALNGISHSFDKILDRNENLYSNYDFEGNQLKNISFDFSYRLRNYNYFGEYAFSSTGGSATILGTLIGLDRNTGLAVLWRNYDHNYNALESNGLGESSKVNNESGIYLGIENRISPRLRLSSYVDFWHHRWVKFNISKPSAGYELLTKLEYRIKRRLTTYVQFFYEFKEQDETGKDTHLAYTGIQERRKLRLHLNNTVSGGLELRTRLEFSWFNNESITERGYLFFQDVIYRPLLSPFSFTARFALFDTGGYNSRIFAYENSVLNEFAIPSYFDQGFRYYINLRYRIYPHLTLETRFSRTYKSNKDHLRSGPDRIEGDSETQIKFQIRYQF